VLLSSLPGAAITAVHIDGIQHEFSDIPGIKEDVTELILNLKKVRLRSFRMSRFTYRWKRTGRRWSRLATFAFRPGRDRESEQHLCTIDAADGVLSLEIVVERGIGYYDIADQREETPIGRIPVDGIFSPVERVNFTIDHVRVGQMTNFEHLVIEVWTDGTIDPNDALTQAASILTQHFQHLAGFGQEIDTVAGKPSAHRGALPPQEAETAIEDLQLSARAENSLKRAGLSKVGQVVELVVNRPQDVLDIRNFGQKSYDELIDRLKLRKLIPENFATPVAPGVA
jgi:DNA-directed RNA polymerase subunit alpha